MSSYQGVEDVQEGRTRGDLCPSEHRRPDVENQIQELRRIAERRGWEVVEVYTDAGISGAKGRTQRPGLDYMVIPSEPRRISPASTI
jgi:DNA invertase Pin-like site-specific DNA recombinase